MIIYLNHVTWLYMYYEIGNLETKVSKISIFTKICMKKIRQKCAHLHWREKGVSQYTYWRKTKMFFCFFKIILANNCLTTFLFWMQKRHFFARDWAVFWRVVLKKGICTFQVHKLVLFKYLRPNWITIHFFHYYSIFLWYQKRAGLLNDDDFFFKSFFISYFHNWFFQWQ